MNKYTVGPRVSEHTHVEPDDDGVYVVENTGHGPSRSVCVVVDHQDGKCDETARMIVDALNAKEP